MKSIIECLFVLAVTACGGNGTPAAQELEANCDTQTEPGVGDNPTCFVLVTNGQSIGAVLGLYFSKGIGSLIIAFIAPHGVLELTAICIAGGAGLLLGAAFIIPGDRTRRRALVENGKRSITLVAGATFLLVGAGIIEGFISPIPWWPLELKLTVCAVTALLLYAYLRQGVTLRARPVPSVPDID